MAARMVGVYFSRLGTPMYAHEKITLGVVAKMIAQFKRCEFMPEHDNRLRYPRDVYFVPDDTLMLDEALCLGIRCPNDFFGGVVPYPFVKTKAITHQLIDSSAHRPEGWSSMFAERVRHAVLPGYTVFSRCDARAAAERLVRFGLLRLKPPLSCGGGGQALVATRDDAEAVLERYSSEEIAAHGLVLETNLRQMTTRSVGQISIDDVTMTYHGTQRVATDNEGRSVYGGSDLVCVRGGWEALDALPMTAETRLAIAQARSYDEAADEYPGFLASRRNYDVGQGIDGKGGRCSGVLEASWRSGGASTAELAALTTFVQNPALRVVEASAVKEFGKGREAPQGALVHFRGDDPRAGPILRYTVVTRTLKMRRLGRVNR